MLVTQGAIGVMVLTGLDKRIEALAVNESPQRLTDLTTQFRLTPCDLY
jgi:hypothetical protein